MERSTTNKKLENITEKILSSQKDLIWWQMKISIINLNWNINPNHLNQ